MKSIVSLIIIAIICLFLHGCNNWSTTDTIKEDVIGMHMIKSINNV